MNSIMQILRYFAKKMQAAYRYLINKLIHHEAKTATYRMPAEWEPHQRTFMAWPGSEAIWEDSLVYVQKDIARLANAIAQFEPVVMLANPWQVTAAQSHLGPNVEVIAMEVDDLWTRDTCPVFLCKQENGKDSVSGVVFNFNGWGNKQIHKNDALVARKVLDMCDFENIAAHIVSEGGSLETDGNGTLLVTVSSLVNKNRNNKTLHDIEMELKKDLGMKKVIWFDGLCGEDITDCHVDGLVRFIRPGVVVLSRPYPGLPDDCFSKCADQAYSVLQSSTDADGNPFEIIEIYDADWRQLTPDTDIGTDMQYCMSYVNFFIGNGFVAVPEFGQIESDLQAQEILQAQFPERIIVPVRINAIAEGGGGIHCSTHEQPAVRPTK